MENRRKTLKTLLLGFAVFFIISGVWIGVISQKEGEITYSTSGEFNHDLVGPYSKGRITQYLSSPYISSPGTHLSHV